MEKGISEKSTTMIGNLFEKGTRLGRRATSID
jgi:hypothetical protein